MLHTGDNVELGAFPVIDRWAGGSIDGLIAAADAIVARTDDATRTVPGHGGVASRDDVVAYRAMLAALRDRVACAVANGERVDALIGARITAPYEARHGGERQGSRFLRLLHDELALQQRSNR